ncbi:oligosaccharide flippase family protein [Patescibacteria group bacterium]
MEIKNFAEIKNLLLNNKTVKQTILKNTFWLTVTEGISKLAKLALLIYVARILGATEYGKFTFALAFVSLFIIFFDLGLSQITTREISREKEKEKEFSAIFSLKILLGLGTSFLILIISFFTNFDIVIQKIIWILAACFFVENITEIIVAFFRARQKMEYESLTKILGSLTLVGVGLIGLFYFPSILNLSYSYLLGAFVALIFALIIFQIKIQKISFSLDKSIWKKYLIVSWPLALVAILSTFYNQIDSVMMGYLGQFTETGWYNAAYRIIWPTLIPITLISISFFPVLSKYFKESKEKLQNVWNRQIEVMILLAFPLLIGGMVLAPKIISFIYDQSFAPSILAFQILIIMAGIIFLYSAFYQVLIAANQQRNIFWAVLSGAIINITLNLILIPKFSLYGAAFSTVITHLLVFFFLFRFTLKFTPVNPFNSKIVLTFIGAIFSSVAMYLAIIQPQIYNLHVIISILTGIVVYLTVIFVFKYMVKYFGHR